MTPKRNLYALVLYSFLSRAVCRYDVWNDVSCNKDYMPEECKSQDLDLLTVDDFDNCGPAYLKSSIRNYFLGASGRRLTYKDNKDAFERIKIVPKLLRDVSRNELNTTILGLDVDFPIGLSPVALQRLAHPDGEIATVKALSSMKIILIVSNFASTLIEEIGRATQGHSLHLWLQVYLYKDKRVTVDLVRRGERSGFKGIVVTADSPVHSTITCNARQTVFYEEVKIANVNQSIVGMGDVVDASSTFSDITWLKAVTKLPIIVKGILTGEDATRAILAGASAILVSNHGGRQIDGTIATIDALPGVVAAVNKLHPRKEVYMDGGVRSGHDIYKAIARGAKMVLVGRPIIWGLTLGGSEGVRDMITILKKEFNQTMLIAGASNPSEIKGDTLLPFIKK